MTTTADLRRLGLVVVGGTAVRAGAAPAKGKAARLPGGYRSKLERDYAAHLRHLKTAGELIEWSYEPQRFKLAEGAMFTPDFRLTFRGGRVEFHETKGFMREAARLRLKVAAERHPFRFVIVRRDGPGWSYEKVPGLVDEIGGAP